MVVIQFVFFQCYLSNKHFSSSYPLPLKASLSPQCPLMIFHRHLTLPRCPLMPFNTPFTTPVAFHSVLSRIKKGHGTTYH